MTTFKAMLAAMFAMGIAGAVAAGDDVPGAQPGLPHNQQPLAPPAGQAGTKLTAGQSAQVEQALLKAVYDSYAAGRLAEDANKKAAYAQQQADYAAQMAGYDPDSGAPAPQQPMHPLLWKECSSDQTAVSIRGDRMTVTNNMLWKNGSDRSVSVTDGPVATLGGACAPASPVSYQVHYLAGKDARAAFTTAEFSAALLKPLQLQALTLAAGAALTRDKDGTWTVDGQIIQPAGQAPAAPPAPGALADHQEVEVSKGGAWSKAVIVKHEGRRFFIHYDAADGSSDEWVGADRIRAIGAGEAIGPAAPAPGPAPAPTPAPAPAAPVVGPSPGPAGRARDGDRDAEDQQRLEDDARAHARDHRGRVWPNPNKAANPPPLPPPQPQRAANAKPNPVQLTAAQTAAATEARAQVLAAIGRAIQAQPIPPKIKITAGRWGKLVREPVSDPEGDKYNQQCDERWLAWSQDPAPVAGQAKSAVPGRPPLPPLPALDIFVPPSSAGPALTRAQSAQIDQAVLKALAGSYVAWRFAGDNAQSAEFDEAKKAYDAFHQDGDDPPVPPVLWWECDSDQTIVSIFGDRVRMSVDVNWNSFKSGSSAGHLEDPGPAKDLLLEPTSPLSYQIHYQTEPHPANTATYRPDKGARAEFVTPAFSIALLKPLAIKDGALPAGAKLTRDRGGNWTSDSTNGGQAGDAALAAKATTAPGDSGQPAAGQNPAGSAAAPAAPPPKPLSDEDQAKITLVLAQNYLNANMTAKGKELLESVVGRYPKAPAADTARKLLQHLQDKPSSALPPGAGDGQ